MRLVITSSRARAPHRLMPLRSRTAGWSRRWRFAGAASVVRRRLEAQVALGFYSQSGDVDQDPFWLLVADVGVDRLEETA
jgi:hypothetical protein